MAPEAILDATTVQASADLYSVGAVAYFLLVGEPVFSGATVLEVCMRHVHEAAPSVASRSRQAVPPELDALVLCCLEKQPGERPPSAAALVTALLALQRDLPWHPSDADAWWHADASGLIAAAKAAHVPDAPSPGPHTLAVDWSARAASG